MTRECLRVLEPGGRLAVIAIETGAGLTPEELDEAAELGPSDVRAPAPLADMLRQAGFEILDERDLTHDFERDVAGLAAWLEEAEGALREAEGDVEYDYERARRSNMLEAIRRGLIRRSYVLGARPPG